MGTLISTRLRQLAGYSQRHPLGFRMMVYVSACSFLFILLSTALQLTLDYRRELRAVDQQVALIRNSYLASLAKSLWDLDQAQIELQLKGILTLPDLVYLELSDTSSDNDAPTPSGERPTPGHQVQQHGFELIHTNASQQQRTLGRLDVTFDLQAIHSRLWQTGLSILLNQTLLVMLIVLVILVIFQRQITRHLESMAEYSRRIGAGELDQPLTLNRRKPTRDDELDQLAAALNEMRQAIQQDIQRRDQEQQALRYNRDQLQQMVERRTESLQRAKEAAEEANNAKSQFLSTMSHEIRTPMNGMLGMIQLLENSTLTGSQREQVRVLHDATESLLETFDHVLQYGQLVEGGHSASESRFSVNDLLSDLVTLMKPGADKKGLRLKLASDIDNQQSYFGAAGSLRQILTNLLANAIKFTDRGAVQLRCRQLVAPSLPAEQAMLRFEIQDSGIGIAPELQAHIFDRFTQADESITRRFGGTGLGLAICKELAVELGGSIGLHSEPGKGSLFWLEIPLRVAQQAHAPYGEQADTQPQVQIPPLEILLVEDVEINQQVVLGLLQQHRHRVTLASDGYQALQLCGRHRFDLILMDMHLPGLGGLEVSQRIIQDRQNPNRQTPIVALTASVGPDDIRSYLDAGLHNVVAKPVRKAQLLQALAGIPQAPAAEQAIMTDKATDTPLLDNAVIEVHRQVLGEQKLTELMRSFCTVHAELWPALQRSLAAGDRYDCGQLAHKLAGACDTMGFTRASLVLRALEAAMEAEENSQAVPPTDELAQVMTETLSTARAWLDKL
ncbi:ATP-binding protein [Marinobacterium arenosum]|uniref:ATP-binding protein n=1 Tax=Marinobacterium arenosum TaxID=2862496 RepID=UPI001C9652A0|nr:ATP-binding protein [Marinobacterium arenosum]MBY4678764.1 response regulator [Marinobacterium arenosum]